MTTTQRAADTAPCTAARFAIFASPARLLAYSDQPFATLRVAYRAADGFILRYTRGRLDADGAFTPQRPDEYYTAAVNPAAVRAPDETYEVLRYGCLIVQRIGDDPPEESCCGTPEQARALFAEHTADPAGPGAPRPGDRLSAADGEPCGTSFVVREAIALSTCPSSWALTCTAGHPITADYGRYTILARPLDASAREDS